MFEMSLLVAEAGVGVDGGEEDPLVGGSGSRSEGDMVDWVCEVWRKVENVSVVSKWCECVIVRLTVSLVAMAPILRIYSVDAHTDHQGLQQYR